MRYNKDKRKAYISSGVLVSKPTASACSLPSAMIVTTEFTGRFGVIIPPFDVKPGHIMFAPDNTNVIAPLSTFISGQINGSRVVEEWNKGKLEKP